MKLPVFAAVGCAATVLVLAGCSGGSAPAAGSSGAAGSSAGAAATASGSPAASIAAHYGGTFTMLWNAAGSSIDPAVDYDANWYILRITNDGLLSWKQAAGPHGNDLVPDLATAIPAPADGGKTYTFTLRPGIRFSTGAPVQAADVAYALTREFKVPGPGVSFYSGLVGGQACITAPKHCDLSRGIVTSNAARTVTFHLVAPNPNFLEDLALPFAFVVPPGTPNADTGATPLAATGPYMIKSYGPNRQLTLVRNPYFRQWSAAAQPQGFPSQIVMKIGVADEDAVTQVENGQADWMYDVPPADRLNEIATRFARQIHISSTSQLYYMALNTRIPPFSSLQARQALNFATDRKAVVQLFGGSRLATPTCQILPPNFPSYQPNCPYTKNPGTKWSAPDLDRARQLVAQSGTKGDKVVIISSPSPPEPAINLYFVSLLNQLGYQASIKTLTSSVEYPYVQDSANNTQMDVSYWVPDYPAAADFLNVQVGCAGFHPHSSANPNLSYFCDPAIKAQTEHALQVQQTNLPAANVLWTGIDKEVTAKAPQVSLFVQNDLAFVSSRVGNFQYSPAADSGFLIDQAWVK